MVTRALAFNNLLAYLLPGIVALYPVYHLLSLVECGWPSTMPSIDPSDWPVVLFGLPAVSLLLGLTIDAFRYVFIDFLVSRCVFRCKLPEMLAKLRQCEKRLALQSAIDAAYAHHQFYVNTALVLLVILIMWCRGFDKPPTLIICGTGSLCVILIVAGIRVYWTTANQLKAAF